MNYSHLHFKGCLKQCCKYT